MTLWVLIAWVNCNLAAGQPCRSIEPMPTEVYESKDDCLAKANDRSIDPTWVPYTQWICDTARLQPKGKK